MDVLTPEQEKSLQALHNNGVFKLAVQNAYNHIIITDPEGTILYANQAVTRITGYSQSEVIGKTPDVWGGQMPEEFYNKLWETIRDKRCPFIAECTNKKKDGNTYSARITISPIVQENGDLLGFVGVEEEVC